MKEESLGSQNVPHLVPYINNPFTQRQTEVLLLKINGFTGKEIARKLKISSDTVSNHITGHGTKFDPLNPPTNRMELGIYGLIRLNYGIRPRTMENLISILFNNGLIVFHPPEPVKYTIYSRKQLDKRYPHLLPER